MTRYPCYSVQILLKLAVEIPPLTQDQGQVLNDDLRATFDRWYPGLKAAPEPAEEEAA
jgi:hypothetical protein